MKDGKDNAMKMANIEKRLRWLELWQIAVVRNQIDLDVAKSRCEEARKQRDDFEEALRLAEGARDLVGVRFRDLALMVNDIVARVIAFAEGLVPLQKEEILGLGRLLGEAKKLADGGATGNKKAGAVPDCVECVHASCVLICDNPRCGYDPDNERGWECIVNRGESCDPTDESSCRPEGRYFEKAVALGRTADKQ